jgi:pimeloyl-ACP methyl ester carboxylesterase
MRLSRVALQPYSDLRDWVNLWKHPTNKSTEMFYTMAWDWRRDLWEQSTRVLARVETIYNATQCRPILVGHSYGGRLIYTGLGRYKEQLARYVAGVLYAVAPLQTCAGTAPGAHRGHACKRRPM